MTRKLIFCIALVVATMTLPVKADYQSEVISDMPLSFWEFEDASSSEMAPCADTMTPYYTDGASPGVYRNNTAGVLPNISLVTGVSGKAAAFYGTIDGGLGNFVQIYDSSYTDPPYRLESSTSLTVEFWTNATKQASETWARFISHASGGTTNYWVGMTQEGATNWGQPFVGVPNNTWYAWPPYILTDLDWHHVVVTYQQVSGPNTVTELWIDGISRGTREDPGTFAPPGDWQDLIIGAENNPYWVFNGLVGAMDEVAYYDYVLGSDRIEAHFNAVPEPATIALLGLGGLLLRRKR